MASLETIFGDPHVQLALLVVFIGVAIRTLAVYADSSERRPNPKSVGLVTLISFFSSMGAVTITLAAIPDDADGLVWIAALCTTVMAVYSAGSAAGKIDERLHITHPAPATTTTVTATAVTPPMPDFDIPEEPADDANPPPKEAA